MSGTPVGNRIRRLRFDHGEMTQGELAERVGITRQTVIALEAGKYAPSLELAFRIARGINQLYYTALLAGAAAAVLLIVRRPGGVDRWMLLGVAFAAYLTLISIVYSGQSRFHIPAMPFVMIYDAWLLLSLARRTA